MGEGIASAPKYDPHAHLPASTRVGYVIPLGAEARSWVRRVEVGLRERYGANPALVEEPHITVKQAFEVEAVEPFERYLDRVASEVEPFEIVLRGIGVFEHGIVFLDVVPEPRLEALRRRVLRDLSAEFGIRPFALEDGRYHFHATLAYGLSDEQASEARTTLEREGVEFRFPLDALALLYHTLTGWITYRRSTVARIGPATPPTGPAPERRR
jgi:2'-5' RNA ligase